MSQSAVLHGCRVQPKGIDGACKKRLTFFSALCNFVAESLRNDAVCAKVSNCSENGFDPCRFLIRIATVSS
jgi:hypothetical protein